MKFDEKLYQVDFLVYSAHKTGTQTVSSTLRLNGVPCIHCHSIQNYTVGIDKGLFADFLKSYYMRNGKKLAIITVFREPLERHISSFFQWHGHGEIVSGNVTDVASTIIQTKSISDLQGLFIKEIREQTLIGRRESIYEFCHELDLHVSDLDYNSTKDYGFVETAYCCIYLLRFDTLFSEGGVEKLFSRILGRPISKYDANRSMDKWYRDIWLEFKSSLSIPLDVINTVYESRRSLIELFYYNQYDCLLLRAFNRFARPVSVAEELAKFD
jgi:hypothetical protein